MDKDFLKFMSFVAFMESKKEAEKNCSATDTGWQVPYLLSEESPTLLQKRFFSAASGCPKSR